jgi:pyrimidine-nucleoside phosphorylase
VDLSGIKGVKVDKHSTGGVGDKTTLVVGPLASACGVPIAKMSGRGLGFTGGTVDKMESIPGFRTTLEADEFISLVNRVGLSVIGQTAHIAPADKKIYALRDVTATVDNLSLITSSVMSKKLASGSDAIVLDVKCGSGAFMERFEDACELGGLMVEIGKADGKKTIAVVTDMNQPLGLAVGNSLEVIEAIETLKGKGPEDITELSLVLASYMIYAGDKAASPEEGYRMAKQALESGAALSRLAEFLEGQGGDPQVINDYALFPQAACSAEVRAEAGGYVGAIQARSIGLASQHAGAGRATKEDSIDLSAGIVLNKKVGDSVQKGDLLATVFGNDQSRADQGAKEAAKAFLIQDARPEASDLVKKVIQ